MFYPLTLRAGKSRDRGWRTFRKLGTPAQKTERDILAFKIVWDQRAISSLARNSPLITPSRPTTKRKTPSLHFMTASGSDYSFKILLDVPATSLRRPSGQRPCVSRRSPFPLAHRLSCIRASAQALAEAYVQEADEQQGSQAAAPHARALRVIWATRCKQSQPLQHGGTAVLAKAKHFLTCRWSCHDALQLVMWMVETKKKTTTMRTTMTEPLA